MPVQLYYTMASSPPSRAVLLTLKTLNIPYELHNVDLSKGEQKSKEYLQCENTERMINCVYPKDVRARLVVDHRLHFDTGVLFQAPRYVKRSFIYSKTITGITPEIVSLFEDAYNTLEKLLPSTGQCIVGNQITIGDFSIITTLANMSVYIPVKKEKHSLLAAYIERCNANISFCEKMNAAGIQVVRAGLRGFNFELPPQ